MEGFDFGENWDSFSRKALTSERIEQARRDFSMLIPGDVLRGKTFLDIGFGQGLSLLIAAESGAKTVGVDMNPRCAEVLARNRHHFPSAGDCTVLVGSILDDDVAVSIRNMDGISGGVYDIVHSWGVLHHTGAMWRALEKTASFVADGGLLAVALYNTHWSNRVWTVIKWLYCHSHRVFRRMMVLALYPVIVTAKFTVTGRNPLRQERGMDFYHDVVDWVGGYPYEYASVSQVVDFMSRKGFTLRQVIPATVPTGCNQYLFANE